MRRTRKKKLNINLGQFFKRPSRRNNRAVPEGISTIRRATILVYAGVLVVGFGYLVVNKHVTTVGYEMRGLEIETDELIAQQEELDLKALQLQSLSHITEVSTELALQPSDQIHYLTETGSVALQD